MHIELKNEMASIRRRLIDSTRKVHIERYNKMCAAEFVERTKENRKVPYGCRKENSYVRIEVVIHRYLG